MRQVVLGLRERNIPSDYNSINPDMSMVSRVTELEARSLLPLHRAWLGIVECIAQDTVYSTNGTICSMYVAVCDWFSENKYNDLT